MPPAHVKRRTQNMNFLRDNKVIWIWIWIWHTCASSLVVRYSAGKPTNPGSNLVHLFLWKLWFMNCLLTVSSDLAVRMLFFSCSFWKNLFLILMKMYFALQPQTTQSGAIQHYLRIGVASKRKIQVRSIWPVFVDLYLKHLLCVLQIITTMTSPPHSISGLCMPLVFMPFLHCQPDCDLYAALVLLGGEGTVVCLSVCLSVCLLSLFVCVWLFTNMNNACVSCCVWLLFISFVTVIFLEKQRLPWTPCKYPDDHFLHFVGEVEI